MILVVRDATGRFGRGVDSRDEAWQTSLPRGAPSNLRPGQRVVFASSWAEDHGEGKSQISAVALMICMRLSLRRAAHAVASRAKQEIRACTVEKNFQVGSAESADLSTTRLR